MASRGVALYGGSFNPVHNGHLIVARAVREMLDVPRMVLIPSAIPPHKRPDELASAQDRLDMLRLAIEGEPCMEVSDIELRRQGPSYTFDTVSAFRAELGPEVPLYWVIGGDSLPELHSWYRVSELVEICTVVTAVRPGFETPDLSPLRRRLSDEQIARLREGILPTPRIDISATDIRRRIHQGRSIRFLVPDAVLRAVQSRNLYASQ